MTPSHFTLLVFAVLAVPSAIAGVVLWRRNRPRRELRREQRRRKIEL